MRMVTVAAMAAVLLLASMSAGCLTPLTSQQPLTPVPVPERPLVGVYEPSVPGNWSDIARPAARTPTCAPTPTPSPRSAIR